MVLTRGARVGQYEVIELLGSGATGEVYRARDDKLGRHVAIKILTLEPTTKPPDLERLEREARAASALNHPGIVTIHDTGDSDGRFFIVMELIEGTTLRHHLRRGAPPLKRALHIASQLADALAKAHEVGIVHRDLKPENVMVSNDGHVKIVDFGLAKLTQPAFAGPHETDETITDQSARGMLLGTAGYMSPEQASGTTADFRSDQFAFGAILYELVTGARAFHRDTTVETLAMIINDEPEPAAKLNPQLPPPLSWTIERCLAKNPVDRYASTRDLAREMQTLRDHTAVPGLVTHLPAARRIGAVPGVALVAALALAVIGYLAWPSSSPITDTPGPPFFKPLTFARGHVVNARFTPDGLRVLYAAAWRGAPVRLFETDPLGPEARMFGPAVASLASVSTTGELAIILGCSFDWGHCVGTLARMPAGSGAPREVLDDVMSADWTPAGDRLAAIQLKEGEFQLHFPSGNPIYTTEKKINHVRVSPDGTLIGFVEYDVLSDEMGVFKVIDLEGNVRVTSRRWNQIREFVWIDRNEVWMSASDTGPSSWIYALPLDGNPRPLIQGPGALTILDVAPDRRALVAQGLGRAHLMWTRGGERRELTWLDWSTVADVSADGTTVLFYEWGDAVGTQPMVYTRNTDGSDAVRLGQGKALALSPDGRWALAVQELPEQRLVLLPTGVGTTRPLAPGGLTDFYWARWFPDGQRLLIVGARADGVPGSFVLDLQTERVTPVTEPGVLALLVAPDGERLLVMDPLEGYMLWPINGGARVALPSLDARDRPIQWSADGRHLYVKHAEELVVSIYRFDLATGAHQAMSDLSPRDSTGVVGVATGRGELAITPDGRNIAFTYWTFIRDLYLVTGLR